MIDQTLDISLKSPFLYCRLPLIPQISSGSLHASNIKFTGNGYNQTFIQFDGDFHIKKGPFKNAAVWDQLFPKPHD